MGTIYYQFPFDKVLNYLSNNVSNNDLSSLYAKYNIDSSNEVSDIEQLASCISDEDVLKLGYTPSEDEQPQASKEQQNYKYSDVSSISDFLAHKVADYILEGLMNQYNCYDCDDLALALTDDEIYNLGYGQKDDYQDNLNDEQEEEELDFYNHDYDEDLDYLDDVPYDIPYAVIDKTDGLFATKSDVDYNRFKGSLNPCLVRSCEDCNSEYPNDKDWFMFKVKPNTFDEVSEEVIINDELNSDIFDSEHNMLPEIKNTLLDYVNNFVAELNDRDIELNFSDVVLIGSNAGYLYTPDSDIDIHLISSNPLSPDFAEFLFDAFDVYEAENPLMIGSARVELGIEDGYDVVVNNKDARRYSLISDEWVNDSDNFEQYKPEDINKVDGYEGIVDGYEKQIEDAVNNDNIGDALALKQEIRQNRTDDLANIGSLSMGNVVFKELRAKGAYQKLRDYILSKKMTGDLLDE